MQRPHGLLLAAAGAVLILSLTLWPSAGESEQKLSFWCLLCGSRDLADSLLNLLLFVPFGAGLTAVWGPWAAVGSSLGLSSAVELIQTNLPGRFSTLGDILSNTLGGAAGAALVVLRSYILSWAMAPPPWLRLLAALAPPAAFLGTAAVSAPQYPDTEYYGQWAHEIGRLIPYPGEIVAATVGGLPLPDHRVPDQEGVRQALREGEPLLVRVVAGPQPTDLSHLFAIYDHTPRELLLVAVQGSDLFFQRRTRSMALRLDQPFVRWRGALKVPEGDTIRIMVRQEHRSLCIEVDRRARCDLAAGVGGGWRLIHRLWGAPAPLAPLLGVAWLSILCLPAGGLVRGRGGWLAVGLGLGALGIVVSWWSPWLSVRWLDLVAPIPGTWAGWRIRSHLPPRA